MRPALVLLSTVLALAGCDLLRPYRIDINQGNVLTQEDVDQLRQGMNKSQIQFLLGTPSMLDPFHLERWEYVYSITVGWKPRAQRRISLTFDRDILVKIDGDLDPVTGEPLTEAAQRELESTKKIQRVMERQRP